MRKPVLSALIIALVVLVAGTALAQKHFPGGMPDNSKAFGKSYGEWSAAWWKWALEMPYTAHPLYDTADCSAGQKGNVWFLGGKFCASNADQGCADPMNVVKRRSCTVPPGTALLIPVLNAEDSYVENAAWNPNTPTEMDIRAEVKAWQTPVEGQFMVSASVDEWPLKIVRICASSASYCTAAESPLFDFTLPNHDNILAMMGEGWVLDGTTSTGVADGFFVLIPPLPAGKHTVAFYGRNGNFSLDITYDVVVGR